MKHTRKSVQQMFIKAENWQQFNPVAVFTENKWQKNILFFITKRIPELKYVQPLSAAIGAREWMAETGESFHCAENVFPFPLP